MLSDSKLIIEVSNHNYDDYSILGSKLNVTSNAFLSFYTDGCVFLDEMNGLSYNFAFIDQRYSDLSTRIKNIINTTQKTKICIAVHERGRPIVSVRNGVNRATPKAKVISIKQFKHEESYIIWENGLKPFVVESVGKNFDNYQELYENLWHILTVGYADHLRAEILTPFIPFHLYYQFDNKEAVIIDWKETLKKCRDVINGKTKIKLGLLLEDIQTRDVVRRATVTSEPLLEYYASLDGGNLWEGDCRQEIERFATCLEDVVNAIESRVEFITNGD